MGLVQKVVAQAWTSLTKEAKATWKHGEAEIPEGVVHASWVLAALKAKPVKASTVCALATRGKCRRALWPYIG